MENKNDKCKECRTKMIANINNFLEYKKQEFKNKKATIIIRTVALTISIMTIIINLILFLKK